MPFNIGVLYALNGAGPDRLRYADWGLWAGGPLPATTTCPSFDRFQVCGGSCGGCPSGETCVGRSHLHPYGFCVSQDADTCSSSCGRASERCFVFTVEPAAQALADANGFCLPQAECTDVAANLPGGGKCIP